MTDISCMNSTHFFKWFVVMICIFIAGCLGSLGSKQYIKDGMSYIENKDWDKSVQYLRPGVKKYPDNVDLKMMLLRSEWEASLAHMTDGEALIESGKFDAAITELQKSLSYNSSNYRSATLLKQAEKYKKAEAFLKEGKRRMNAGNYSEARDAFEKALIYHPDNREAQKYLSYYYSDSQKEAAKGIPPKYHLKPVSNVPISLRFRQTPITNVFEILSKLSGINFIFDKDLNDTKVTLFMTDVSFERFVEVLLRTNGLAGHLVNEKTMLIYPDTRSKEN